MVELKNIGFIPEPTKKNRKISRTLHWHVGSIEKYEADQEKGLKFNDLLEVGRDAKPFKRRKLWFRVWRNKKTGRFAKKPTAAERRKQLGLRNYSLKTKTPKT